MRNAAQNALIGSLLALVNAGAIADARVTLTLKPHVVVDHDTVRLADVADIETSDAVLQRTLSAIRLGETATNARVYGRGTLAMLIKQGTANPLHIDWEGAERVAIERRTQTLEAETLVTAAREHLSRALREFDPAFTRVDVRAAERIDALRLPTGTVTVVPRTMRSSTLSKRTCVWLDVSVDGQVRRHFPVWLAVSAYKPVLVSAHALAARAPVANNDFRIEERDVTDLMRVALSSTHDVTGARAQRSLPAGAVMLTGDVEALPAVARDQEVRVQVASGSVLLETSAVAEQEGKIGDQIRLRNVSSDRSYLGRVVGMGQVSVSAR